MNPKDILKAIDPKGAEIEELKAVIQGRDVLLRQLQKDLRNMMDYEHYLKWFCSNGILVETKEGMKYLKDEDFDYFITKLPVLHGFGDAPIKAEGSAVEY